MKVILKQDVENLGRKGDTVEVAPGYGRNYLVPQKLALEITASNMKMIEIERQSLQKKIEQERLSFKGLIQKLNEVSLTFTKKAGEKDVIFGSVSPSDIREELGKLGFEIDKKKILLAEPIKRLGNYTVPIKVYHDDRAEIKVELVREEEDKEEKKEEVEEVKKEEKVEEKAAAEEEKKKEAKEAEEEKKEEEKEEAKEEEREEPREEEKVETQEAKEETDKESKEAKEGKKEELEKIEAEVKEEAKEETKEGAEEEKKEEAAKRIEEENGGEKGKEEEEADEASKK